MTPAPTPRLPVPLLLLIAGVAAAAPIRQADVVLHDAARGKDLEVRVTTPEAPGRHPVIVWSHGAFGSGRNYGPLAEFWAAKGYAVLRPTHSDSLLLAMRRGRSGKLLADPFRDWRSRPRDVAFLLDSRRALEAEVPGLAERWDPETIGLGGHSFGAQTTMVVGGIETALGPGLGDPRPRALVMISPQGPGPLLGELRWRDASRPQLHVTGSEDRSSRTGKDAAWRLEAFRRSRAPTRYLLYIEGADHAFGGIGSQRPGVRQDPEHVEAVRAVTTAFWDAHLRGSELGRRFLQEDEVASWTSGAAHVYQGGAPLPPNLPGGP